MGLRILIYTFLFGSLVGYDKFGNKYYQRKGRRRTANNGRSERWLIYNDIEDAKFIPPMWHSWLHHNNDNFPSEGLIKPTAKEIQEARSTAIQKYFSANTSPAQARGQKELSYNSWSPKP